MEKVEITLPARFPAGKIEALNIPQEKYLDYYAEHFYEWVDGVIFRVAVSLLQHHDLKIYLQNILDTYLAIKPIGQTAVQPFVMRLENSFREPDIQVILGDNRQNLTRTEMHGPADICIEIVSPESVRRDYGDKFAEYEAGGVREYWLIDPLRQETRFYRLQATGHYATVQLDEAGNYQTPLLPDLKFEVNLCWQEQLPDILAVTELVKQMLSAE